MLEQVKTKTKGPRPVQNQLPGTDAPPADDKPADEAPEANHELAPMGAPEPEAAGVA